MRALNANVTPLETEGETGVDPLLRRPARMRVRRAWTSSEGNASAIIAASAMLAGAAAALITARSLALAARVGGWE